MKRYIVLFIVVMIAVAQGCAGKNVKTDVLPGTVEEQIVKEFDQRKIVMLADFVHGDSLSWKSLHDVLYAWLKKVENKQYSHIKLTLVLERNEDEVRAIKNFLMTGRLAFLNKVNLLYWSSLETLESFVKLRKLWLRLIKINSQRNAHNQIVFDLFGAEKKKPLSVRRGNMNALNKWHVYKRDIDSANRIKKYLKTHPETKLLIFYGGAHLQKKMTLKAPGVKGFWLGYHLKKYFGENEVLTIIQYPLCALRLKGFLVNEEVRQSILVKSKDTPWNRIPWQTGFDRLVVRSEKFVPLQWLSCIYSRKQVYSIIRLLKIWRRDLPGFSSKIQIKSLLKSLYRLSGKKYLIDEVLSNKFQTEKADVFKRILSAGLYKQLHQLYYGSLANRFLFRHPLYRIGFNKGVVKEVLNHPWRKESLAIWKASEKQFRTVQAIGLNWIGYPAEQRWAKAYLKKVGAPEYKEPHKYLRWWRMKHYGTKY